MADENRALVTPLRRKRTNKDFDVFSGCKRQSLPLLQQQLISSCLRMLLLLGRMVYRKQFPLLLNGNLYGVHSASLFVRFNDDDDVGKPTLQSVSLHKRTSRSRNSWRIFRHPASTMLQDLLSQASVGSGINVTESVGQDCHRFAMAMKCALVPLCDTTLSESAHDGDASLCQALCNSLSTLGRARHHRRER